MTCNCSQLGELPGIIAKPEYQVCYQKVYARVNYNAKDTNGNFPCRVNPCYSLEFVEKTISFILFNDIDYLPKDHLLWGCYTFFQNCPDDSFHQIQMPLVTSKY